MRLFEYRHLGRSVCLAVAVVCVSSLAVGAQSPEVGASASSAVPTVCPPQASLPPGSPQPVHSPATSSGPTTGASRFEADRFSLGYELPAGWSVGVDVPNARQLIGPAEDVFLNIAVLDAPIDPDDPEGRATVAIEGCAAAFIDWLARHPYMEGPEPAPASVAGLSGSQVDVVFAPPDMYASDCGPGCVNVLRFLPQPAELDRIAMDALEKDRYIALDANGAVLILNIWTPDSNPATGGTEAAFTRGLEAAQPILDSMTFEPIGS